MRSKTTICFFYNYSIFFYNYSIGKTEIYRQNRCNSLEFTDKLGSSTLWRESSFSRYFPIFVFPHFLNYFKSPRGALGKTFRDVLVSRSGDMESASPARQVKAEVTASEKPRVASYQVQEGTDGRFPHSFPKRSSDPNYPIFVRTRHYRSS